MGHPTNRTRLSPTMRVLIVDDDNTFADALVAVLRGRGLYADAVYSGAEAIACALHSHPDFVVMDLIMEGIDGVDAAIAISETEPAPCILLMSGHPNAQERLAKGSVRGHVFELLVKPIQTTLLLQKLARHQGHRGPHHSA